MNVRWKLTTRHPTLGIRILTALKDIGVGPELLTAADLSTVDSFWGRSERIGTWNLPSLGSHLPKGNDRRVKFQNMMHNLEEGWLAEVLAVSKKTR